MSGLNNIKFLFIALLILNFCVVLALDSGDVVINEIMWMGTSVSVYDEFMELRNMTGETLDFSIDPWSVYKNDEIMVIIDDGLLLPMDYFLIARLDSTSALDIPPDLVSAELVINNSDAQYRLYAGLDHTYPLIDIADDGDGAPAAGRYGGFAGTIFWSMERNEPPGDGTLPGNWHNGTLTLNFITGAIERGTPGAENRCNEPPVWSDVLPPEPAIDDSDLIFSVLNPTDEDMIPDSLQIILTWWKIGVPFPIYSTAIYGIPSGETELVVIPEEYTDPGYDYIWNISLDDGAETLYAAGTLFVHFNSYDIIIDELCWCGSSFGSLDEWFEILNMKDDTINFEQTPFYLWRFGVGRTLINFETLDSGCIAPDERWLLKRFPAGDSNTVVETYPDIVLPDLTIYDGMVYLAITDKPDTYYTVDRAGNMLNFHLDAFAPGESLWTSISRIHPPNSGELEDSWHVSSVSLGFIPDALDRGTPGYEDILNTPPVLQFPETLLAFEPDTGTRDSVFRFRVVYSDADNDPPDFVYLLIDKNANDYWEPEEYITMFESGGTDYTEGVVMLGFSTGLSPRLSGCEFTFRGSDGLVTTSFPIPGSIGPVVLPSAGMELSETIWRTDTLIQFHDRSIISMPFRLVNTGDLPAKISLKIAQEDTFEYSGCGSFSEGGWRSICCAEHLFCNEYMLSAMFLPDEEIPDSAWFNQFVDEDCLRPNGFILARENVLGHDGISAAENLQPEDHAFLWFQLILPDFSVGLHGEDEHRIVVEVRCMVTIP